MTAQRDAIGIDPALLSTGVAWPRRDTVTAGLVKGLADDGTLMQYGRVYGTAWQIRTYVMDTVTPGTNSLIVIEAPSLHSQGNRTVQIGGLHYLLRHLIREFRYDILDVPPNTVKLFATGKGNADKVRMVTAARERLGYDGFDDDEADALWLQQIGRHMLGHPAAIALPKPNLAALNKLELP